MNGCAEEKEPRSEMDGAAGEKGCIEKRCGVQNSGTKEKETTQGCVESHR